ncbi:hypothetical protein Tco_0643248 [Tanacetum coccineum]
MDHFVAKDLTRCTQDTRVSRNDSDDVKSLDEFDRDFDDDMSNRGDNGHGSSGDGSDPYDDNGNFCD